MALPGFGLSCKIDDVDFLHKAQTPVVPRGLPLEVRVNGVICEHDADRGINQLILKGTKFPT